MTRQAFQASVSDFQPGKIQCFELRTCQQLIKAAICHVNTEQLNVPQTWRLRHCREVVVAKLRPSNRDFPEPFQSLKLTPEIADERQGR